MAHDHRKRPAGSPPGSNRRVALIVLLWLLIVVLTPDRTTFPLLSRWSGSILQPFHDAEVGTAVRIAICKKITRKRRVAVFNLGP